MEANQRVKRREAAIVGKSGELETARSNIVERQQEGAEAEKERARVEKKRDKELAKGGKLKALEEELSTLVKELARFATQVEIKEGSVADERKKVEELQKALEDVCIDYMDVRLLLRNSPHHISFVTPLMEGVLMLSD